MAYQFVWLALPIAVCRAKCPLKILGALACQPQLPHDKAGLLAMWIAWHIGLGGGFQAHIGGGRCLLLQGTLLLQLLLALVQRIIWQCLGQG
jgi:hypothetical protein